MEPLRVLERAVLPSPFPTNQSHRSDGQKTEKVGPSIHDWRSIQSHYKRFLSSLSPLLLFLTPRNTLCGDDNLFLDVMNVFSRSMVITFISCRQIKRQFMSRGTPRRRQYSLVPSSMRNNTAKFPRISRSPYRKSVS
jgi:hypothetical protein